MERRRSKRASLDVQVDYDCEGTFLFTYIMDVSASGLFIHSHNPHPRGTRLSLRFVMPGDAQPTVLQGEVVWSSSDSDEAPPGSRSGMGIEFVDPDDSVRQRLMALVEREQEDAPCE